MLHEFLTDHRDELIERCRAKVGERLAPIASTAELEHGISRFLDQLIKTLRVEQTAEPAASLRVSGPAGGGNLALSEISETATLHGRELLRHGFTVEQVVHDYGDLCQAITDLAFEHEIPIAIDEFRTLNRCLDNGIAVAVTEFIYQRDFVVADEHAKLLNTRLGIFAHELRNHIFKAQMALTAIKTGNVGLTGATGAVLDRSLVALVNLINRSLSEVRMTAGLPGGEAVLHQLFSVADFIAEVKLSASLEAQLRECVLTVSEVDPWLAVDADRDLLLSAVGNLLQNAFKFTHQFSEVTLNAYAAANRILIEVADHCGGLQPGATESMFQPFMQGEVDRSGLGLGLSIARHGVEVNDGVLSVRDRPGSGCVFTIDLPRRALPDLAAVA